MSSTTNEAINNHVWCEVQHKAELDAIQKGGYIMLYDQPQAEEDDNGEISMKMSKTLRQAKVLEKLHNRSVGYTIYCKYTDGSNDGKAFRLEPGRVFLGGRNKRKSEPTNFLRMNSAGVPFNSCPPQSQEEKDEAERQPGGLLHHLYDPSAGKKPARELHRRKPRDQAREIVSCLLRHGKRREDSSDKCFICYDDDEDCELTYFYGQNCDPAANHLICASCAINLFEITRKHDATCPICRQVLINKKKR